MDLSDERRKLAASKEIPEDRRECLRIDELLRGHGLDAWIEERHALLDEAFRSGQTDAALVGEQFADGTDATAAEMVDVVQRTFTLFQAKEVLGGSDEVGLGENA